MTDRSNGPAAEQAADGADAPLPVTRGNNFVHLAADTANVEVQPSGVEISILTRSLAPVSVRWGGSTQPSEYELARRVEEVAVIRMTPAAANDLAMNLISELVSRFGLNVDSINRNLDTVRNRALAALADRQAGA